MIKMVKSSPENPLLQSKVERSQSHTKKTTEGKCGLWKPLVFGISASLLGLLLTIWTPFHILMNERLRMRPGLPPYEWWKTPPDKVLLRVYVFNITNSEAFLNGTDKKLNVEEVGPIIFLEKVTHSDVIVNDNDTMTYSAKRSAIYLPMMNHIDLNQTLIVPNIAVLGIASYLWDWNFVTKMGFNYLLRKIESQPIVKTTIYNFLWNFTDPVIDLGHSFFPVMVPTTNLGILTIVYEHFEHTVTSYMGTNNGHSRYFLIDKFDGSEYLPHHDCKEKLVNSTEGVTYHQFLTKNETILYWRKTQCKVIELDFERELFTNGFNAYRFTLRNETFHRQDSYSDCFKGNPPLPNGLIDVSKCYFDLPISISFPHFLNADPIAKTYVNGLKPSNEKHGSFVDIEPVTGVPLESRARLQSNLILKDFSGLSETLERFSDITVPLFWLEYNQVGIPTYMSNLIFFLIKILPSLQIIVVVVLFCTGLALAIYAAYKFITRRKQKNLQHKIMRLKGHIFCN
ncbi:hypothetical protein RI129_007845 [Pyrocoelia pectoralis]|uniref:Scavenger receptor class B member 1 n=1 Tax=Pyrocoelia pectoralis TaxID=417401 RepID=A0AAN7ZF86_9COLE